MKIFILSVLVFVQCYSSIGQIAESNSVTDTTVYSDPDTLAFYPGGDSLLYIYIRDNYKFSDGLGADRTVAISFNFYIIVSDSGVITKVKITDSDKRFKQKSFELEEVLRKMPNWIPAVKDGKKVNSISFYYALISETGIRTLGNISQANLDKDKSTKYYNSGVEKTKVKDYEGATADFKKVLELYPNDIDALYNLGVMYLKLKNIEEACSHWQKIKALNNSDADNLILKYCNQ